MKQTGKNFITYILKYRDIVFLMLMTTLMNRKLSLADSIGLLAVWRVVLVCCKA